MLISLFNKNTHNMSNNDHKKFDPYLGHPAPQLFPKWLAQNSFYTPSISPTDVSSNEEKNIEKKSKAIINLALKNIILKKKSDKIVKKNNTAQLTNRNTKKVNLPHSSPTSVHSNQLRKTNTTPSIPPTRRSKYYKYWGNIPGSKDKKAFLCPHCEKYYNQTNHLAEHFDRKHTSQTKNFIKTRPSKYDTHIQKKNEKYTCKLCPKSFANRRIARRHIFNKHK